MLNRSSCVFVMCAGVLGLGMAGAFAQTYPSKPIRIVAAPIGSGADLSSRLIGQAMTGPLGQPIIVDNRPAGVLGQVVSQSPPDGYTLLYHGSGLWVGPLLLKSPTYDAVRDFQPITHVVRQPGLLVVHPALPVKSGKDLIALARSRPGELNYAIASLGSLNHLSGELFNSMAGVRIQRVEFKGGGQMITSLLAGEVQVLFGTVSLVMPHVKSGRLKALAVTSALPSELLPGVPTLAATGLPGYESVSNEGIFAPAKTPRAIVDRLNQEIVRALSRPDVREKLFANGAEPVRSTPEQMEALVAAEIQKIGKVLRASGIREQ